VCIELEGPVGETAFRKFEDEVKKAIKAGGTIGNIKDADFGNKPLKVKKTKAETKPKP
jgi:hypothetical protein